MYPDDFLINYIFILYLLSLIIYYFTALWFLKHLVASVGIEKGVFVLDIRQIIHVVFVQRHI